MLEHFNRSTRIIIGVALAILIWITGIIIGQEQTITILNPEGGFKGIISGTKTITVSLMLDYGNGNVNVFSDVPLNYGESVMRLLSKADHLENNELNFKYQFSQATGQLESFSILGYNNQSAGKQWLAWVNNGLQTKNINEIQLKAGDIVELKYIRLKN